MSQFKHFYIHKSSESLQMNFLHLLLIWGELQLSPGFSQPTKETTRGTLILSH